MWRRRLTPDFTHGTLRFCTAMTPLEYLMPTVLPVPSSGDENRRPGICFGVGHKYQRFKNLATASVRVLTWSFS